MKFRKKPVVIEAAKWIPCAGNCAPHVDDQGVEHTVTECGIRTLEGVMRLSPGDFIITGVKGERYPCKPDIFEATYESAELKPLNARVLTILRGLLEHREDESWWGTHGPKVYEEIRAVVEELDTI